MRGRRLYVSHGLVLMGAPSLSACDKKAREFRLGISLSEEDREQMEAGNCKRSVMLMEVALATYYRANKAYPPRLNDLAPMYLN